MNDPQAIQENSSNNRIVKTSYQFEGKFPGFNLSRVVGFLDDALARRHARNRAREIARR